MPSAPTVCRVMYVPVPVPESYAAVDGEPLPPFVTQLEAQPFAPRAVDCARTITLAATLWLPLSIRDCQSDVAGECPEYPDVGADWRSFTRCVESLSALPSECGTGAFPVVLEAIPYRRCDMTSGRDTMRHVFTAAVGGVATLRLDLRGSGDSDGVMVDEYSAFELQDICTTIEWIARQPWCNGRVGMVGKSWGGFNSAQVAFLRPPALRAIVVVSGTHDRYAEDVHYIGGCVAADMLPWASVMLVYNALPPDCAIHATTSSDGGWRDRWIGRLRFMTNNWAARWLTHQTRDAYWQHGSVVQRLSNIAVPSLIVGGVNDGYITSVFAMNNAACQQDAVFGIAGPWAHQYPEAAQPGPGIGFNDEAARWWNTWLRDPDDPRSVASPYRTKNAAGVPHLRAFETLGRSCAPTVGSDAPGSWRCFQRWPSPHVRLQPAHLLANGTLSFESASDEPHGTVEVRGDVRCGVNMGSWWGFGEAGELPGNQSADVAGTAVFRSAPLAEDFVVAGSVVVKLCISSDTADPHLVVRLVDEAADGSYGHLVAYGVMNCHFRDDPSFRVATAVPIATPVEVAVTLRPSVHRFKTGRRITLMVSPELFPLVFPCAKSPTITIHTEKCVIELPSADASPAPNSDTPAALFSSNVRRTAPRCGFTRTIFEGAGTHRSAELSPDGKTARHVYYDDVGATAYDGTTGAVRLELHRHEWTCPADDPTRATVVCRAAGRMWFPASADPPQHQATDVLVLTWCKLSCDEATFILETDVSIFARQTEADTRAWLEQPPGSLPDGARHGEWLWRLCDPTAWKSEEIISACYGAPLHTHTSTHRIRRLSVAAK